MKTIAVLFIAALLSACEPRNVSQQVGVGAALVPSHPDGQVLRTVVIEGCEYLFTEVSVRGQQNYAVAITHKGNCKNPIHAK